MQGEEKEKNLLNTLISTKAYESRLYYQYNNELIFGRAKSSKEKSDTCKVIGCIIIEIDINSIRKNDYVN